MWVQAAALLLACCVWPAQSQRDGGRAHNIWENPISFNTKGKDKCTMIITGQGENTRLRISCRSSERFYWCEFVGKPHTCSAYNKRPRHYFVQMMWYLRKLQNACQGQRQFKPFMCRKASDDSQMVFSSASSQPQQQAPRKAAVRPAKQPAAPSRPTPARQSQRKAIRARPRVKPTQMTNTKATPPPGRAPQRKCLDSTAGGRCRASAPSSSASFRVKQGGDWIQSTFLLMFLSDANMKWTGEGEVEETHRNRHVAESAAGFRNPFLLDPYWT